MITSRAIREFEPYLYCSIAAAVLGAGALSAGAGIWGASNAANAQKDAANASIANQQAMFGKLQGVLSPFINAGSGAIPGLQNWLDPNGNNPLSSLIKTVTPNGTNTASNLSDLYSRLSSGNGGGLLDTLNKLVTPGANQDATLSQTPGYQFSVDQGTRAAQNALAARGLGGSPGAVAKGVGGYVSGVASQNYNQSVQNLINAITSNSGVVGAGTNLLSTQAGVLNNAFSTGANAFQNLVNSGVQAGGVLGNVGTNTANQVSSSITGAGNAQAAADNATGASIGGFGNSLSTAALLKQLTSSGAGNGSVYGGNTGFTPQDAALNSQLFPNYGTG